MIQKNWQDLIKPTKLQIVQGPVPERRSTIVAEPLERGFGLTLGNALRRVLLSSLQGAAVGLPRPVSPSRRMDVPHPEILFSYSAAYGSVLLLSGGWMFRRPPRP